MSSVELARRLGTRQPTAWLIKHKLMAAMAAREAEKPKLAGRVEVDDAYLGGRALGRQARPRCGRQDAVRGRGRDDGRAQAAAAAAHRGQGLPQEGDRDAGQARLRRRQQRRHATACPAGRRSSAAGCDHFPMVTGSGPQAAKWVPFTWVNTALGNIKTALAGTYHHVSAKHAQRYLPASPGACMGLRESSFECRHRVPSCVEFISVAAAQPRFGARRSEGSSPSGADHRATSLYPADPWGSGP